MNNINKKLENNEPIISGFEIKKQFKVKLRIKDVRNIGKLIKSKWDKLLNS